MILSSNLIYRNTFSEVLKCNVLMLFFIKKDYEFNSWPQACNTYFILNYGISHAWKKEPTFWVLTLSPVQIPVFQSLTSSLRYSVYSLWSDEETFIFVSFLSFDMRCHPHLTAVYGFMWYFGGFSQKKSWGVVYRSPAPKVSPISTCLFIHMTDYLIIRLFELHCRGQGDVILKSTNAFFTVCHGTHFYFWLQSSLYYSSLGFIL